jgi:hypothetical protein
MKSPGIIARNPVIFKGTKPSNTPVVAGFVTRSRASMSGTGVNPLAAFRDRNRIAPIPPEWTATCPAGAFRRLCFACPPRPRKGMRHVKPHTYRQNDEPFGRRQ